MIKKIVENNTITLARAFLALSFLLTLLFNSIDDLFPKYHLTRLHESQEFAAKLNFFLWFESPLLPYIFSVAVLSLVIVGFYPRIICFFQCWTSYSLFYSMLIVEGGDQINIILTILLIPISILDGRINAWKIRDQRSQPILLTTNAKYSLIFIKIQMAVLYFHAAVGKIYAPEWSTGTAVYYWFNDNMFGAPVLITNIAGFLFRNDITVSILNWSVIALEILLFTALFMNQSIRYLLFTLAFTFHFMIVIIHGLPTFWLAMTGGLILYLIRLDLSITENYSILKESLKLNLKYDKL